MKLFVLCRVINPPWPMIHFNTIHAIMRACRYTYTLKYTGGTVSNSSQHVTRQSELFGHVRIRNQPSQFRSVTRITSCVIRVRGDTIRFYVIIRSKIYLNRKSPDYLIKYVHRWRDRCSHVYNGCANFVRSYVEIYWSWRPRFHL